MDALHFRQDRGGLGEAAKLVAAAERCWFPWEIWVYATVLGKCNLNWKRNKLEEQ